VKTAQARGDFHVLVERGRRALHVHLGRNLEADLTTFERAMAEALK
jgi:transaldolase / glucose-6-phosphate isomerase